MRLKDIGEIGLIKRLARTIRYDSSVIKGIGDDAAVIRWTKDKDLLFTCDMLVEGVHFRSNEATPYQIGWKALARNVSDIAAMGGVPKYALVSIAMDPGLEVSFLDGIYKGISDVAKRFKINMVGGDMSKSKKLVIDISLVGQVERENLTLRSGAKRGDVILVTGYLGGSIKGKHLKFIPRLEEARALVRSFRINSMIDISDGLVLDLWRVLDASKVGARIYENAIPISREADSLKSAISDGEDFELLFTMSAKEAKRFFRTALPKMATPVTLIGEITDKRSGYRLLAGDGKDVRLAPKGYLHF